MTAPPVLTPREWEIARLFALGKTWDEVVHEMGCRRQTAVNHRRNAMEKSGSSTMAGLWMALGWLRVPRSYTAPPAWRQG